MYEIVKKIYYLFPTHVGMIRLSRAFEISGVAFPHARGDDPFRAAARIGVVVFSPRTWG